jgi:hypothetical protein
MPSRPLPTVPMTLGEFPEVVLRGRLTPPDSGGGRLTAKAERFLGRRLGASRWIMLTTKRLLVIAPFAREGDWFDVSFERRAVRAGAPHKHGDLVLVDLRTPSGPQVLRLPATAFGEAARFAKALGART